MNSRKIIEFWGSVPERAPYLHPADAAALDLAGVNLERHGIYPNLFPQPWVGPIKTAKAFILQLNPGFSGPEVEIERSSNDFREALRENLLGELPNVFLDSRFIAHPGRRWVESHLRGIASIGRLATAVAQVELFPYHSQRFANIPARVKRVLLSLPSVQAMRAWMTHEIVPAALSGQRAVVVQRSSKNWQVAVAEHSSLVIYRGGECRGGWITQNTRGGKLIMNYLRSQCAVESDQ